MKELYEPELTQWLQYSGEYIGSVRPAEERVGWILFLLDEVRSFLGAGEYGDLLRELDEALGERLDEARANE